MIWLLAILAVLCLLALAGIFVSKYGQVRQSLTTRIRITAAAMQSSLWPYFRKKTLRMFQKTWHFMLEAKDLMPATTKTIHDQAERVKNVFKIRIRSSEADPQWLPEAQELAVKPLKSQNPEELYLAAIQKDPHNLQAYEALGRLYLQNKNFSEAAETYEFLIHANPGRDTYHSNLGLAYYSSGQYQKAAGAYEQALKINSKVATRWVNLSLCFNALDDNAKTVKALLQALALDKFNTAYMMMLANEYLKIPNAVRAEEVLEQILMLEPMNKLAREKLMRLKV